MQNAEQLIVTSSQAVSCELSGETVILDIPSGQYFALSEIESTIWKLLESPSTLKSVCGRLMEEYDVEPDRCEADVSGLLDQLAERGLITFEDRP